MYAESRSSAVCRRGSLASTFRWPFARPLATRHSSSENWGPPRKAGSRLEASTRKWPGESSSTAMEHVSPKMPPVERHAGQACTTYTCSKKAGLHAIHLQQYIRPKPHLQQLAELKAPVARFVRSLLLLLPQIPATGVTAQRCRFGSIHWIRRQAASTDNPAALASRCSVFCHIWAGDALQGIPQQQAPRGMDCSRSTHSNSACGSRSMNRYCTTALHCTHGCGKIRSQAMSQAVESQLLFSASCTGGLRRAGCCCISSSREHRGAPAAV